MERRTFLKSAAAAAFLSSTALPRLSFAAGEGESPLLAPWEGPYGGVPPFDKVTPPAIRDAITRGLELARAEVSALAGNAEPPTFENTLAAFEDSGRPLYRARTFLNIYTSTMNDDAMQAIDSETAPILAGFDDEVVQNDALFGRLKAVHDGREGAGLTAEQLRLTEVTYRAFERTGAALSPEAKKRAGEINQRLATLFTNFGQNMLADEENYTLVLETEADTAGLPDSIKAAAAAAAAERNLAGKWVITNTRSSMEPFLTFSSVRPLREKGWRMWISRGDNGDAHDNKATIAEMLTLRQERAKLLGFPTHAHWIVDNNMAKTPEAAMDLLMKIWGPAAARAREEIADMQAAADAEGAGIKIEAWDYRYYAEKVRKAKYDIDQNEVKPYLQMDKIREGMFWAAGQVYKLEFVKVDGVPVYHPDMSVYEVKREGAHLGLWYFDPYARAGKRSGAWMNAYRTQERFRETTTPIVSNNCNYVKGAPGEPVLISWDDASTMFHEFGHALHGLLSNVAYPTLAGTNVKRDFVEFPSQINEHWLPTDEVLNQFAVHYQTGEPMPAALLEKIKRSENFNQGFINVEYLASAIYDLKIHQADATQPIDAGAFEKQTMAEIGCPAEIVMRHRPTGFAHIFGGDGYSAGYYVYAWADTLTADAAEAFVEAGGYYDRATSDRFYECIMSVGNTIPPDEAFRRFRGRDVDTNALLRKLGFA